VQLKKTVTGVTLLSLNNGDILQH